jgi:oxygen-independent coproporphyrinogen-3 oxidase
MLPLMRQSIAGGPAGARSGQTRTASGSVRHYRPFSVDAPEASETADVQPPWVQLDDTRPLIIGIIPHTQCNPKVDGCGFCTFPHDHYNKSALRATARSVASQIEQFFLENPAFSQRRVDAVYIGGATANLTPRNELIAIGEALSSAIVLSNAEVTLEGTPNLFHTLLPGAYEALLALTARCKRISFGVQTFDRRMLAAMGRQSFGDKRTVARVVEVAHKHDVTTSGDFLVNLPNEPIEQMLQDVDAAASVGLDQICIYHLVLGDNHGTPWSLDATIRGALPNAGTACDNWLRVREHLLSIGYVQQTLTNFERSAIAHTDRRFVYEEYSFTPAKYDCLGFGPLSISTFINPTQKRGVKFARGKSVRHGQWGMGDLYFPYEEQDIKLLFLTREFVRLSVSRTAYRAQFGEDPTVEFAEALDVLQAAGLLHIDQDALHLTPKGMYFADSVVGLLAWQRVQDLRSESAGVHTRDALDARMIDVDYMG